MPEEDEILQDVKVVAERVENKQTNGAERQQDGQFENKVVMDDEQIAAERAYRELLLEVRIVDESWRLLRVAFACEQSCKTNGGAVRGGCLHPPLVQVEPLARTDLNET